MIYNLININSKLDFSLFIAKIFLLYIIFVINPLKITRSPLVTVYKNTISILLIDLIYKGKVFIKKSKTRHTVELFCKMEELL